MPFFNPYKFGTIDTVYKCPTIDHLPEVHLQLLVVPIAQTCLPYQQQLFQTDQRPQFQQ